MAEDYATIRTTLASVRAALRRDTEQLEFEQALAEQRAISKITERTLSNTALTMEADREKLVAKAVGSNEADRKRNIIVELAYDSTYQTFKDRVRMNQDRYDELQAQLDVLDREQRQAEFATLDKYADALLGHDGTTVSIRQHPAFDSPRDIVVPGIGVRRVDMLTDSDRAILADHDSAGEPLTDAVVTASGRTVLLEREMATINQLAQEAERKVHRLGRHIRK